MIPRFIVRNAENIIKALIQIGYEYRDSTVLKDILVIGNVIQPAPIEEQEKVRLIRSFDGVKDVKEIILQAMLQSKWRATTQKLTVIIGTKDVGVQVTRLAVLIDSFLIPIEIFRSIQKQLKDFKTPFLAAHVPLINPEVRFITVGCADYSLNDLDQIIAAHESLTKPTP